MNKGFSVVCYEKCQAMKHLNFLISSTILPAPVVDTVVTCVVVVPVVVVEGVVAVVTPDVVVCADSKRR